MAKIISVKGKLEILGENLVDLTRSISVDEVNDRTWEVADATTDEAVNFAGITTASVVWIESDQDITYKANSSATAGTVQADGAALLWDDSVTALTISNASGSTAIIRLILAGT